MKNKEFIIRFLLFLGFSLVIPIVYIVLRCKLYEQVMNVSFWFILLVGIVIIVVSVLIKYYLDGMKTKYSMMKQVLSGAIKVLLPIMIILLIAVWFQAKMEWIIFHTRVFIEIMSVILGCEVVAIIVNPLPKWAFLNNVDGIVEITDKILHKDGE